MEITRIPAQWERKKTRIAIYCRVSTKMEEQEDSLEMQREAYLPLIRLPSGWELVGVYSDNLSGLIAEKRPKFMQMINDALEANALTAIIPEKCLQNAWVSVNGLKGLCVNADG